MIELEKFLAGQQQVYDKFRAAHDTIRKEGAIPPKTVENRDGYLVILEHPAEIVERCADVSRKIAAVVPAMVYEGIAVHTTIGVVGMHYRSPEQQRSHPEEVALLKEALHSVSKDFPAVTIPYEGWLYNKDTTIAQGIAGETFVRLAGLVHQSLQKYNAHEKIGTVQQPWGGHITVSRFMEKTPPEKLDAFFDLVRAEPLLPSSTPRAVSVGYVSVKNGNVVLEIKERFPLP
ncbi:MAG: hypothetical protein Q8R37_05935 [Nanoarchaeota archaeon]|nr:hypothetical protein [Nanoarchaeota archaeon]